MLAWENPRLAEQVRAAVADVEAGRGVGLGDFTQYADTIDEEWRVSYQLRFAPSAAGVTSRLVDGGPATAAKLKKVRKALGLLQSDPMYPCLHSHRYQHFPGIEKGRVWDSYVENHTPGAWRIYLDVRTQRDPGQHRDSSDHGVAHRPASVTGRDHRRGGPASVVRAVWARSRRTVVRRRGV